MTLFAQSGQKAAALRQYEVLKRSLAAELDVEPAAKTTKLLEQIRDRTSKSPASLPTQTTPFIGRETELDKLAKLLAKPDIRLVTILAPGGMGKTRLALEAGAAQFDYFANGVYYISLSPLESADGILSTIAEAVNFQFYSGVNPQQQLLDYFREKQVLLLLDNFEHLLEGTRLLNEILRAAPGMKVLVTSRVRLNLRVETVYVLGGMTYQIANATIDTPQNSPQSPDESGYSAIRLFVDRAQRVYPDFEAHAGNLNHITHICQLVGGMPLGIELAAAWAGLLSMEEIIAEIQGGLDFLAIEMQDTPKRHRSIRAVLDRSWDMLEESNQEVFKKLTVFRGGFTWDAAQKVAGASLQQLLALANQTFIRRTRTGRYQIHELLRQFADEKLEGNLAEKERVRQHHCDYYAAFLQQEEEDLMTEDPKKILVEIDNIRAAWRFAVKRGNYSAIRKASFGLFWFYEFQGWYPEQLAAFKSAADALRENDPAGERGIAYGQILYMLGEGENKAGQHEIAYQHVCKSQVILRRLGTKIDIAKSTDIFAHMQNNRGIDALPVLQESLVTFEEEDLSWGITHTLNIMGEFVGDLGDYAQAEEYLLESLKISESNKISASSAYAYRVLGDLHFNQGDYWQALHYFQAGLVACRKIVFKLLLAVLITKLGEVATILGEYDIAEHHHQEALDLYKDFGFQERIASSIMHLGDVSLAMGKYGGANERYQEALEILKRADLPVEIGFLEGKFGNLAVAMGNYHEGQERYRAALEVGLDFKSIALILDIYSGVGILLAQIGETERAIEIATLALNHIRSDPFTRGNARQLLGELEVQVPAEIFSAAQERGISLDVEATAQGLVKDFTSEKLR